MDWTKEEKAMMFDQIAKHYYSTNFGTFSKADMDLLMFHFLLEKEIRENKESDDTLDYNSVSDYALSKKLGITQQRIKALKIKKQLIYPIEYDWKSAFAKLLTRARFDRETQKIIISIPDPNLLIEIQNFVEEQGGYISTQFNSKLLQLRVEYFLELAVLVDENEESRKKIIKKLKEEIKRANKDETLFDEKNIGKSLLDAGVNVTSIIANLTSIADGNNIIANAFLSLLN